jgi:hypothetical protein
VTDPDNQALTVVVVIQNGTNLGDFLPSMTSSWARSTNANGDIIYTQTFLGPNVGSLAQTALRSLSFMPRAGAVAGQKTLFSVTLNDGSGSVGSSGEISVLTN